MLYLEKQKQKNSFLFPSQPSKLSLSLLSLENYSSIQIYSFFHACLAWQEMIEKVLCSHKPRTQLDFDQKSYCKYVDLDTLLHNRFHSQSHLLYLYLSFLYASQDFTMIFNLLPIYANRFNELLCLIFLPSDHSFSLFVFYLSFSFWLHLRGKLCILCASSEKYMM